MRLRARASLGLWDTEVEVRIRLLRAIYSLIIITYTEDAFQVSAFVLALTVLGL